MSVSAEWDYPAYEAVVRAATAAETCSTVVVMGALARSGLKRLLIGNAAERVLDRLPSDLLVIGPRGFRGKVPRRRRGAPCLSLRSGVPSVDRIEMPVDAADLGLVFGKRIYVRWRPDCLVS